LAQFHANSPASLASTACGSDQTRQDEPCSQTTKQTGNAQSESSHNAEQDHERFRARDEVLWLDGYHSNSLGQVRQLTICASGKVVRSRQDGQDDALTRLQTAERTFGVCLNRLTD
jgi:hypothetical protein